MSKKFHQSKSKVKCKIFANQAHSILAPKFLISVVGVIRHNKMCPAILTINYRWFIETLKNCIRFYKKNLKLFIRNMTKLTLINLGWKKFYPKKAHKFKFANKYWQCLDQGVNLSTLSKKSWWTHTILRKYKVNCMNPDSKMLSRGLKLLSFREKINNWLLLLIKEIIIANFTDKLTNMKSKLRLSTKNTKDLFKNQLNKVPKSTDSNTYVLIKLKL